MKKTINIELTVRRMEAQNILTTSMSDIPTTQQWAPERGGFNPYAGLAPVHEGL